MWISTVCLLWRIKEPHLQVILSLIELSNDMPKEFFANKLVEYSLAYKASIKKEIKHG